MSDEWELVVPTDDGGAKLQSELSPVKVKKAAPAKKGTPSTAAKAKAVPTASSTASPTTPRKKEKDTLLKEPFRATVATATRTVRTTTAATSPTRSDAPASPAPSPAPSAGMGVAPHVTLAVVVVALVVCRGYSQTAADLRAENALLMQENARLQSQNLALNERAERSSRKYSWVRDTSNLSGSSPRKIMQERRASRHRKRNAKSVTVHACTMNGSLANNVASPEGFAFGWNHGGAMPLPSKPAGSNQTYTAPHASGGVTVRGVSSQATPAKLNIRSKSQPARPAQQPAHVPAPQPTSWALVSDTLKEILSWEGTIENNARLCNQRLETLQHSLEVLGESAHQTKTAAGHWMGLFERESRETKVLRFENKSMKEEIEVLKTVVESLKKGLDSIKTSNARKYEERKSLVHKDPVNAQLSPWSWAAKDLGSVSF